MVVDEELAPEVRETAKEIARELETGRWEHAAILRVRQLLRGRSFAFAKLAFRAAEIEAVSAQRLARFFSWSDEHFERRKGQSLLVFVFEKVGAADWEMTEPTRRNLMLFFHPI